MLTKSTGLKELLGFEINDRLGKKLNTGVCMYCYKLFTYLKTNYMFWHQEQFV